jgi:hypothetical protein
VRRLRHNDWSLHGKACVYLLNRSESGAATTFICDRNEVIMLADDGGQNKECTGLPGQMYGTVMKLTE